MGEYEDRYPDAYGHGETIERLRPGRHFPARGLTRQVRDEPVEAAGPPFPAAARREPPQPVVRRPMTRTARAICDEVCERLNENPFIDAAGISVVVTDSEVMLDGAVNSLIAVSLARALASNVDGVSAVQVRLKVQPPPRVYETHPTVVRTP